MNPFRLLILGLLFYLLYRLFTDGRKRGPARTAPPGGSRKQQDVSHDVLVADPVCGVLVPKGQAIHLVHASTSHYFCSTRCRDSFLDQHHTGEPT